MSQYRVIWNNTTNQIVLARAKWCASFWCHFKGLQFAPPLSDDEGVLFVRNRESISETTIHMFFMRFDIGVIWVNKEGRVVDKKLAKRWRPYYAPQFAAQYFIEANPTILKRIDINDVLSFRQI